MPRLVRNFRSAAVDVVDSSPTSAKVVQGNLNIEAMAVTRAAQIDGHLYPKGMLADQVAIITGSGQGIGAEAAHLFAKEGAQVVVQDIDSGTI